MPRRFVLTAAALFAVACGDPSPPTPTPAPIPSPSPTATPLWHDRITESTNLEANGLFKDARAKSLDRSRQGTAAAIALLEKAVRLDRRFVRAHAELAIAYGTIDDRTDPLVRRQRAQAAADRAIALDRSSPVAIAARAFVRYRFDWEWARAQDDFAKAVALNPNHVFVRHHHGVFLAAMGRTDDALRELGRAAELEPPRVGIRADMVPPLLRVGRVAEARAALNAYAAVVSSGALSHQLQSDVLAAENRADESAESLLKSLAARGVPAGRVSELRAAYKSGGTTAMLERRIRHLTAEVEHGPSPPRSYRNATDLALAHASLKHRDQTLHWLAVAIDLHEDAPLYIRSSSSFDFVRDDARFKELLKRAKLE